MTLPGPLPPLDDEELVLGQNAHGFDALSRMVQRHRSSFRVPSPLGEEQIVLMDPDEVRHVLVARHQSYSKGRTFANMKLLMGNGLIVQDGGFWRQQRKMIQPLFHERVLLRMANTMRKLTLDLLEEWKKKAQLGEHVDVGHDVSKTTLYILLEALFSDDLERMKDADGKNPFDLLVDELSRSLSLVPRFRALLGHVVRVAQLRIQEGRFPPDLLSMLLAARTAGGEPMPLEQVRDEVATLIVAGHETTAALLTWAWHLLACHPDVEARLHAEVDAQAIHAAELSSMPAFGYLSMVVFETLRLYPPVWLEDRIALEDDTIAGYHVPRGAEVFIPIYFLQRDARFFERPTEFDPERFATYPMDRRYVGGRSPASNARPSTQPAFLAFAVGPRRCIGDQFALLNAQVHLGIIACQLRMHAARKGPLALEPLVNLRPKGATWMAPRLR